MSHVPTPALPATPASAPAPPLTSAPVDTNATVRYLETDLQRIFRTVLKTRPHALAPHPLVFPDGPCKRPLKARFPELYCGKIHMECYNFIQQCEKQFAIARGKGLNRVLLQPFFFENKPCSVGSNTRPKTRVRPTSHSPGKSLKSFFVGTWENLELLLIASGRQLKEIPSINKKKSWIGQLTWSTCKLCPENLTPLSLQMRKFWFAIFLTVWDLLSKPKQMNKVEIWTPERKLSKKPLMLRMKQLVSLSH